MEAFKNEDEYKAGMVEYQQLKFAFIKKGTPEHDRKMELVETIQAYEEEHFKLPEITEEEYEQIKKENGWN